MKKAIELEKLNRTNFRSCLEALSRPGYSYPIELYNSSPLTTMASMFLYPEVSNHYSGQENFSTILALTGSPSEEPEQADYLFMDEPSTKLLLQAKNGTGENPDSGSTIIVFCNSSSERSTVRLKGPGIVGSLRESLPLSQTFLTIFQEKNHYFPMGIELFLINENSMVQALSRTTKIDIIS